MGNFTTWFARSYRAIIIVLVAIMAVMLVVLAMQHVDASRPAVGAEARPIPTFTSRAVSAGPSVEDAMKRLDESSRPWTLTVLGDSTGNGTDEWVYATATALSTKYQRPVTVHDWDVTTNAYTAENKVGGGANAPITIWNSSASGMDASYSLANLKTAMPQQPDLVIISHGHNEPDGTTAVSQLRQLLSQVNRQHQDHPAVAITLQSPRSTDTPDVQKEVVSAVRDAFRDSSYTEIDVFTPFSASDLAQTIGDDGRHPTPAGETLWAAVVAQSLGLS